MFREEIFILLFFFEKKILKGIFSDTWKIHEIQISISTNKDLLDHSQAYLFTFSLKAAFKSGEQSRVVAVESMWPAKSYLFSSPV